MCSHTCPASVDFGPVSCFSLVLSSPAVWSGNLKNERIYFKKIKKISPPTLVYANCLASCVHNIKRKSLLEFFFSFYNKIIWMSWFSHFWSSYHFQLLCTCVLDVSINGSCHQVEQLEHLLRGSILLLSFWAPATTTIRFIYSFPVWTTNEKTTHKILQQQQQQREKRKKRRNVVYPGTCPEIDSRL